MKTFDDFNKMFSNDQKSKVSDVASNIYAFFETKEVDVHLKKYIKDMKLKTKKSSVQIQTDLAMHLLHMLTYSAVELKNVPLLDVIYTTYIQMPGVALNYPISSKKHSTKTPKSKSVTKKAPYVANRISARKHRMDIMNKMNSLRHRLLVGGGELILQGARVVDTTAKDYRAQALERTIDGLPDEVEIIRGGSSMVVNKRNLEHGDIVKELQAGKVVARSSDRLTMASCGGGGRVVKRGSCDDSDVIQYSKENNIDPMLALALSDNDPEFRKAACDLVKETLLLRLRNELKKGKLAENELVLEEKTIEGELSIIQQQMANKREALKVIGELIKSRNLTYAEVFQCGLDAIVDASYYAALTKGGIVLSGGLLQYFTQTTITYYTALKENSDTIKEGEEVAVKVVNVLDRAGGGLLWGFSKILDGAKYVYTGEILNAFDHVEQYATGWSESNTPYAEAPTRERPSFGPNEGSIIPDAVDNPVPTFDLSSIQKMIEHVYMNGIELSMETKKQIVTELISWPAIVFYFAFVYHLYKNIQREGKHKKVLQINASQGAAAAQIIGNLIVEEDEAAAEASANMRRGLIDVGAAIATGGASSMVGLLRSKDKKERRERRVVIESPLGGGAISETVLNKKKGISTPQPITLELLQLLPPIQISENSIIPPPPPLPILSVQPSVNKINSLSSSFSSSFPSSSLSSASLPSYNPSSISPFSIAPIPEVPNRSPSSISSNIFSAPFPDSSISSASNKSSRKSNKSSKSKKSSKRSKSSKL